MKPILARVALTALVAGCFTGCTYRSGFIECPSWAGLPTPEDKYDAADLVVVGSGIERDGTARIFRVGAHSYQVQSDELLKGDVTGGSVRVASMPDPCSGTAEYPAGDPLDLDEHLLISATEQDGEWFTLTPIDGTLPYSRDVVAELTR